MPDMAKAVEIIQDALAKGEKIAVYGDYDVDGVTSTCIMMKYLRAQGADCIYYIRTGSTRATDSARARSASFPNRACA